MSRRGIVAAAHRDTVAPSRPQLWRIGDRETFLALASVRRVRRGAVSVAWLPPTPSPGAAPTPPRAAFAVGRRVGGAVVRNRMRRRLRAALRDMQRRDRLPAGSYLIGGSAQVATMPWSELVADLGDAVGSATQAACP